MNTKKLSDEHKKALKIIALKKEIRLINFLDYVIKNEYKK